MVAFFNEIIRIGQAAHPQLNYKDIDNQGGLPYKPGDFWEVSSPYHTVKPVKILYLRWLINGHDDDDDDKIIVRKSFVVPIRKVKFRVLKQDQVENQNEL